MLILGNVMLPGINMKTAPRAAADSRGARWAGQRSAVAPGDLVVYDNPGSVGMARASPAYQVSVVNRSRLKAELRTID